MHACISCFYYDFNYCSTYYDIGSGKTFTFFGPDEELGADELFTLCENKKSGQGTQILYCIYISNQTYIHTYIQPIKVFNPNRTSTLSDLHSLKYTYIVGIEHIYIHIHAL